MPETGSSLYRECLIRSTSSQEVSRSLTAKLTPTTGSGITTEFRAGTTVWMRLRYHSTRTAQRVFDEYVSGDNYDFSSPLPTLPPRDSPGIGGVDTCDAQYTAGQITGILALAIGTAGAEVAAPEVLPSPMFRLSFNA